MISFRTVTSFNFNQIPIFPRYGFKSPAISEIFNVTVSIFHPYMIYIFICPILGK